MRGMSILSLGKCASNPPSTGGTPPVTPPPTPLTTYYLDCSAASNGSGTQAAPWNSPNDVNSHIFKAGNSLLINRGTTCNGSLQLLGSGASGSPVIVDAYGTGSAPVINGGSSNQALLLNSAVLGEAIGTNTCRLGIANVCPTLQLDQELRTE